MRTDFVPLLPDRTLTVDTSEPGRVTVALNGLGPGGLLPNRVDVILEGGSGEGVALDAGVASVTGWSPAWPADIIGQPPWASTYLGQPVTLGFPPGVGPLRVRVREVERIGGEAGIFPATAGELTERVVFTDTVDVRLF